jgi:hypothetical protein
MSNQTGVTYTFFLKCFKNLTPEMRDFVTQFFILAEEECLAEFDKWLGKLRALPHQKGKSDAITTVVLLKTAYTKMTPGERNFLRLKLRDPKAKGNLEEEKEKVKRKI